MSDGSSQAPDALSRARIGPYEIVKVLERGDRETVYLGIEPTSEREVAIKVWNDGEAAHLGDGSARETAAARGLVHRHILRVLDTGQDEGLSYVVEEVRRGRTLADILRDNPPSLDLPTRIDIVAQLCTGLHYIHQRGLIHGEVKPANVFITSDGVVKLLNFGAGSPEEMTIVSDNALSGSFEYMAPEQLMGRDDVDCRSDIFSAAVILYELVGGRRPFQGPSPAITLARIVREEAAPLEGMPELDALVRRGLEKDPSKRFLSAQEFAYALWMLRLSDDDTDAQASAGESETVHAERAENLDGQGTMTAGELDTLPLSTQALAYAGIAAAVIVVVAGVMLRYC